MVTFSRLTGLLLSVFALAVFAPQFIASALDRFFPRPYIYYSADLDNFLTRIEENGNHPTRDESGKTYSFRERARALPFQNADNLLKWKEFPASVAGHPVTYDDARKYGSRIIFSPMGMKPPVFRLYALLESEPEGAQLSSAPDLFRMGAGIEFIRSADNAIDREKSRLCDAALRDAGFVFPARHIAHSPSPMKPYDNGVLLADSRNRLYHLIQKKGVPHVRDTGVTLPADTLKLQVLEQTRREYNGLYATPSGLFFLDWENYASKPIPHGPYATQTETLIADGDPLNWVFRVHNREGIKVAATDAALKPMRHLEWKVSAGETAWRERRERIMSALFPFQVTCKDKRMGTIRFAMAGIWARPLFTMSGVLAAMLLGALWHCWRYKTFPRAADCVFLAATGLFGLVTCAILGPVVSPRKRHNA